ncbi:MAE_28990/MAE_18760 family HEPN-like nuclease [Serratia ureilytica]|uniref:MAE_28990/MAE_18760 family HEPN-like nuclease n=1 Tax=Serratia ureilytica TaxID=300181 RepID=UPI00313BF6E8
MSSAIVEYIDKLEKQWEEIDRLSELAKKNEHDTALYNSLCRAATVLCVSHLEGFYKDAVKYFISDLNSMKFMHLPKAMKRVFCQGFIGFDNSKEANDKVDRLIAEFESHGKFSLNEKSFLPEKNKNPKPSVLETICSSLGTKDFFNSLDGTIFDSIFSMTPKQISRSVHLLNKKVKKKISNFPCSIDGYVFKKITERKPSSQNGVKSKRRTLWEDFLDDLNTKRHDIAHGNNFDNNSSYEWIIISKDKCRILQLICILMIAINSYSEPDLAV